MYNALKSIHTTLDTIPVTGKENLTRMLGCMQLLETILDKIDQVEKGEKGEKQDNPDTITAAERKANEDDSYSKRGNPPGELDVAGGSHR